MSHRPKVGTLWKVNQSTMVSCILVPINKYEDNVRWYLFDNIVFVEKQSTLLYLGDETIMASDWDLLDDSEYYSSDEYFKKHDAALFLHNDKKIYVLYDDHHDLWGNRFYLSPIK